MWSQLAVSFQQGDGYIYAILGLSFLGLVILIERLIMLSFVYNIDFNKFIINLKKMVKAEDNDRAMNLCKKVSKTSLPYISLRALEAAETDPTTVHGTIEEETIGFLPNLEVRMNIIPAIASLVLMIGVLGSIDGLWAAFSSIDVLDSNQKQYSLSQGIAGSLNHAALGILFSMTLLAGQYLIRGLSLRIIDRIHHGAIALTNLLAPAMAYAGVEESYVRGNASGDMAVSSDDFMSSSNEDYTETTSKTANNDEAGNANFEDSSVDDIKDEEEII